MEPRAKVATRDKEQEPLAEDVDPPIDRTKDPFEGVSIDITDEDLPF
ncbi:hypothetical protein [Enterococcus gilvus]